MSLDIEIPSHLPFWILIEGSVENVDMTRIREVLWPRYVPDKNPHLGLGHCEIRRAPSAGTQESCTKMIVRQSPQIPTGLRGGRREFIHLLGLGQHLLGLAHERGDG